MDPQGLGADVAERLPLRGPIRPGHVHEAEQGAERIADPVGDPRRQPAQRREPLGSESSSRVAASCRFSAASRSTCARAALGSPRHAPR